MLFNVTFSCRKNDNYDYDVYILYLDSDYNKHVLKLKQELEDGQKRPLKMCLPDRDFTVGLPLQDNIMDSIERSSKVIVIISPESPDNEWFIILLIWR